MARTRRLLFQGIRLQVIPMATPCEAELLMGLRSLSQVAEIQLPASEETTSLPSSNNDSLESLEFKICYDGKHEICALCADGGDLIICDKSTCPLVFHVQCLITAGLQQPIDDDAEWFCPRCDISQRKGKRFLRMRSS